MKVDFDLSYTDLNECVMCIVSVDEFNHSFDFIESELQKGGLESDFDINYLSFVGDYQDINKSLDKNQFEDFLETYYASYLDIEVFLAGMYLDIPYDKIEDSYQGEFSTDADFAQQIISDSYNLKDIPSFVEIDWDSTSVNIMWDYVEHNEHYFSNNY